MKKIIPIIAIAFLAACSDDPASSGVNGNGNNPSERETEERGQYYHIENVNGYWCMEAIILDEEYLTLYPNDDYAVEANHYAHSLQSKAGKCPANYSVKCRNSVIINSVYEAETKFTEENAYQCEKVYITDR